MRSGKLTDYIFLQIVDSVIALFRVDFTGRGELAERQVCESVMNMHQRIFNPFMPAFTEMKKFLCSKNWHRCFLG